MREWVSWVGVSGMYAMLAVAVLWGLWAYRRLDRSLWRTWGLALLPAALFTTAMLPRSWLMVTAQFPGAGPAAVIATAVTVPIVALGLVAAIGLWGERSLVRTLDRRWPDRTGIAVGMAFGAVSTAVVMVAYLLVEGVPELDPDRPQRAAFGAHWWAHQLSGWLWGPFQEELIFRGLGLGLLVRLAGERRALLWLGIVIVSFFWAADHSHQWDAWPARVAVLTVEGCIYSAIALRYDLESALAAHVTSNVVSTALPFLILPLFL